jgi:hypothetical protein
MATAARSLTAGTALALAWVGFAQEPPPAQSMTTEQRLAALEAAVATLDTRLGLERTRRGDDAGQSDVGLSARVTALERAVERMTADLQRAERLADSASRAAGEAQRAAMRAEQAARDAVLRAR